MDGIQNIIDAGAKKLETMRQEQREREAADTAARLERNRVFFATVRKQLAGIVPPAVLEYCVIDGENDGSNPYYHPECEVNIPGCAPVHFQIDVSHPDLKVTFETFRVPDISYVKPAIYENEIYEGEVTFNYRAPLKVTTKDFEIAMAVARERQLEFEQKECERIETLGEMKNIFKPTEPEPVKNHDQLLNDMPGDMKIPFKPTEPEPAEISGEIESIDEIRFVHEIHIYNHQVSEPSIYELARQVASEMVGSAVP